MKTYRQHLWDTIGAPLRCVFLPDDWSARLGLTSLEEERISAVLPYIQGRLLDIGAGRNTLVKRYGNGVGIDVYDWGGGALIVEDSANLPFSDGAFDTVTLVASLNHIPNRTEVLQEAYRVLSPKGRLIITMINPILGGIGHLIWWYSEDKERGMAEGEVGGMWTEETARLCRSVGFEIVEHKRFLYWLNNLYLGVKSSP
jgi:SAM-dependent methyltransferase